MATKGSPNATKRVASAKTKVGKVPRSGDTEVRAGVSTRPARVQRPGKRASRNQGKSVNHSKSTSARSRRTAAPAVPATYQGYTQGYIADLIEELKNERLSRAEAFTLWGIVGAIFLFGLMVGVVL